MALNDLITLARAKLNPALASVDETYLAILITAASTQIQRWCNRCFVSQVFNERLDGEGDQTIFLPNFPITDIDVVDFIELDGTIESVMIATDNFTKFFILGNGGEISFLNSNPSRFINFPRGFKNVKITFTGGFSPVPEDVQEACAEQIVFINEQGSAQSSVASEKLGDYAKTFFNPNLKVTKINLSATAFQILSKYRIIEI